MCIIGQKGEKGSPGSKGDQGTNPLKYLLFALYNYDLYRRHWTCRSTRLEIIMSTNVTSCITPNNYELDCCSCSYVYLTWYKFAGAPGVRGPTAPKGDTGILTMLSRLILYIFSVFTQDHLDLQVRIYSDAISHCIIAYLCIYLPFT